MEISRFTLILAFTLGLAIGCTLNDPKPRQKPSLMNSQPDSKPTTGVAPIASPRAMPPVAPDGLPNTRGSTGIANKPEETPATDPKPKIAMEMPLSEATAQFLTLDQQNFRYNQALPAISTTANKCQVAIDWTSTTPKDLAFVKVVVDDNSWGDFSLGLPAQGQQKLRVTETASGANLFHNLTLEDVKTSGEKQRLTIQYLFDGTQRRLAFLTFERNLGSEHRRLVCELKTSHAEIPDTVY